MKCVYVSDLKSKSFKNLNGVDCVSNYYDLTFISRDGYPTRERVDEQVLIDFGLNKPTDLVNMDVSLYYSKRTFIKDNKPDVYYYVSLIQEVNS